MTDNQRQKLYAEWARRIQQRTNVTDTWRRSTKCQYPDGTTEWRIIRTIRMALNVNKLSDLDQQSRKIVLWVLGEHAF